MKDLFEGRHFVANIAIRCNRLSLSQIVTQITNYLGPFALTGLLLPSIKQRAGSRVATVSSSASNRGKIEFDNLRTSAPISRYSSRMRNPSWPTLSFRWNYYGG